MLSHQQAEILCHPITRSVFACLLSFAAVIFVAPKTIKILRALKAGQPIRQAEEVHKLAELHEQKAGTPTMGGIMILLATLVSTLIFARLNILVAVSCFAMIALGLVGFTDDYLKIRKKSSDGISARTKLAGQLITGLIAICVLYFYPEISGRATVQETVSQVFIPFFGSIHITWLCIPFCAITLIAASNAVNLTDGLDGLAAGCTVSSGISFAIIAAIAGNLYLATEIINIPHHAYCAELTVFLMSLVGSCLGFLWFNCHPAKVFMGDTGSLAIGGALGMAAICTAQELVFIIIAGIFVMEAASVVLQVGSYKLRNKKRIFRMAPIHHHFELGGWKETQVIVRFWMMSLLLAIFGLILITFA